MRVQSEIMRVQREIWVVDSSPLILLGKIGLARLLPALGGRLTIPQDVVDEINAAPAEDAGRQALAAIIRSEDPIISPPAPKPEVTAFRLDKGEAAVLSAVLDRQGSRMVRVAVMDDMQGRRAAKALGIPTLGTVAILLRAKEGGEIPLVVPALHSVRAAGAWIGDAFCADVARSAGEQWP